MTNIEVNESPKTDQGNHQAAEIETVASGNNASIASIAGNAGDDDAVLTGPDNDDDNANLFGEDDQSDNGSAEEKEETGTESALEQKDMVMRDSIEDKVQSNDDIPKEGVDQIAEQALVDTTMTKQDVEMTDVHQIPSESITESVEVTEQPKIDVPEVTGTTDDRIDDTQETERPEEITKTDIHEDVTVTQENLPVQEQESVPQVAATHETLDSNSISTNSISETQASASEVKQDFDSIEEENNVKQESKLSNELSIPQSNQNQEKESATDNSSKNMSREQSKLSVKSSDEDSQKLAIPQSHEIVIPSYSKWFNLKKIHSIEKQSLPEFFTNRILSKTPQVYVRCRNYMVNSYRLNPNEYFSVTTARRNICGDSAAIFRVHKFLMKWGLINYQVDAHLLPKNIEPPFTGEYSTRHDAPRGLFPFESYKPSVQLPDMAKLKKMMDTNDSNSALYKYLNERKRKIDGENIKSDAKSPSEENIKGEEVTENKIIENQGSNGSLGESINGVKRPKILEESNADDTWGKEELQKLLKGIQEHGSEWYKIAKEIGTKSPEQCILKFVQLPIEDRFLHQNTNNSDLGPLKYAPHLPFSKSENPVMSTIAFLVGLVDPQHVKEMTNRALTSIEDTKKEDLNEDTVKDGSEIALASLGVRSNIFATSEERQMNAISNELVNIQLQKIETKLKLLNKIEASLELEKRALEMQQENVLVQRLSLTKHTNNIYGKLEEAVKTLDSSESKNEKLSKQLVELKTLLSNPPKMSIGAAFGVSNSKEDKTSTTTELGKSEDDIKPVSIDAPQLYRYWSA